MNNLDKQQLEKNLIQFLDVELPKSAMENAHFDVSDLDTESLKKIGPQVLEILYDKSRESNKKVNEAVIVLEKILMSNFVAYRNSEGANNVDTWLKYKPESQTSKKMLCDAEDRVSKRVLTEAIKAYYIVKRNKIILKKTDETTKVEEYYDSILNRKEITPTNTKKYGKLKNEKIKNGVYGAISTAFVFGAISLAFMAPTSVPTNYEEMNSFREEYQLSASEYDYISSIEDETLRVQVIQNLEARHEDRSNISQEELIAIENEKMYGSNSSLEQDLCVATPNGSSAGAGEATKEESGVIAEKLYDCNLSAELQNYAFNLSKEYGVDFNIVMSMIHQESGGQFNTSGVASSEGSVMEDFKMEDFEAKYSEDEYFADFGLCQINSVNFPSFCEALGVTPEQIIYDDEVNLRCAISQIKQIQVALSCLTGESAKVEDVLGMYNGWYGWEDKPYAVRYSEQASSHYHDIYNKDFTQILDTSLSNGIKTR